MKTKKVTLLFALLILVQSFGFSQGCLPTGITFTTQAQIDSFQTNYPDCTEIEGYVTIIGENITNLNGLNVLTSIGGDVNIAYNASLTNLSGLEGVTSIGGDVVIFLNALTSLTGLEGVTSIGGHLDISDNTELSSFTGLENVTSIGENLHINNNDALASLTGLEGLDSIGGDLTIQNNSSLSNCEAGAICSYLSNPPGIVNIYSNAPGCNNPAEIANSCGFTMSCLPYGNYYFKSQEDVDNFVTDYPGCDDLNGNVVINGEDINNLMGLNEITSIGEHLDISDNADLTSLTGLEGVASIGGNLGISHNDALTSLTGLERVTSIGGDLDITYNAALTSLTGLEGLDSIGGDLWIDDNDALTSFTGLKGLVSIVGSLKIEGNIALTHLNEMKGLISIGGNIRIDGNDALISLTGLKNIDAESIESLAITYNLSLSECAVQSICDYLAGPNANTTINNNAEGCNSVQQVEKKCDADYEQENEIKNSNAGVWCYPNPFTTTITFEYELPQPTSIQLTIYNHLGEQVAGFARSRQVQGRHTFSWHPRNLPAGVYYGVLRTDKGTKTTKMMKMK